jgi:hypothetical protein
MRLTCSMAFCEVLQTVGLLGPLYSLSVLYIFFFFFSSFFSCFLPWHHISFYWETWDCFFFGENPDYVCKTKAQVPNIGLEDLQNTSDGVLCWPLPVSLVPLTLEEAMANTHASVPSHTTDKSFCWGSIIPYISTFSYLYSGFFKRLFLPWIKSV